MAEKSLGVLGTTVATVLGGLVLTGTLALFAYIWPGTEAAAAIVGAGKTAGAAAASAAAATWRFFAAPVPLWAFLLLGAFCGWLWTKRERRSLTDQHRELIEMIAVADGGFLELEVVAIAMNLRRLVVESLYEQLHAQGLATRMMTSLQLTSRGRSYAMRHSLLGGAPQIEKLRAAYQRHTNRI